MTLTSSIIRRLLPCALVVLAACAPLSPTQTEYPVGRARLALPPGAWEDLGAADEAIDVLPAPTSTMVLQARAVALRGPRQELLAVLRVHTNRDNHPRDPVYWTGRCPQQEGMMVEDATRGSTVRVDCLRFKRRADGTQWLEKNDPDFSQWLDRRKIAMGKPYSYLSYRYAATGSAVVEVDALVDPRLLTPVARNNHEFLAAGWPALQWGRDLAQAVRVSTGMMDGYLAIPPFPFAIPIP